jgi:hypothetical protein
MDNYIHNSSVTNNSTNDEKTVLTWSDITKTERTKLHNECRHTIMVRLKEGENSLNNKEVLVKDTVSYINDFIENILGWDMNDEDYYGDFGNELEIFVRGIVFEISNEFSLWKSMNNGSVIGTDDLKGKLDRMYNVFPFLHPDYKF